MKSSRLPGAQGRISLVLSERLTQERPASVSTTETAESEVVEDIPVVPRPRGWWDYVPEPQPQPADASTVYSEEDVGFLRRIFSFHRWRRMSGSWEILDDKQVVLKDPNAPSQALRRTTVRFSESRQETQDSGVRTNSPAPSAVKGQLTSRMRVFREMMRNEVRY